MSDRCVALWAWFIALQCTGGLHHRQGNAARWAEVLKFFDPHFSTDSLELFVRTILIAKRRFCLKRPKPESAQLGLNSKRELSTNVSKSRGAFTQLALKRSAMNA
jgi:hypothetical protein